MTEKIQDKDFIELEYLGKTNGQVFDTNIESEAKKINPEAKVQPLKVAAGQAMLVSGFDKALKGKEIGKKYNIKIQPEEAYGKRNPQMVKMIPKKAFLDHKMDPVAGMTLTIDNALAKIISVSGGRVMTDFNHPLAGKELEFDFTIKRKITDIKEQINAFQSAILGKEFEFDIDKTAKKIIFKEPSLMHILNSLRPKFQDLFGMDIEIFSKPEKKENKIGKKEDKKSEDKVK